MNSLRGTGPEAVLFVALFRTMVREQAWDRDVQKFFFLSQSHENSSVSKGINESTN